jgi:flagellar biosynthesis protein FlhB
MQNVEKRQGSIMEVARQELIQTLHCWRHKRRKVVVVVVVVVVAVAFVDYYQTLARPNVSSILES